MLQNIVCVFLQHYMQKLVNNSHMTDYVQNTYKIIPNLEKETCEILVRFQKILCNIFAIILKYFEKYCRCILEISI